MDARIILGGQQPDFVNVLAQSNQAAQQQINNQSQNALAGYARQNGAAIMQGDQNALAGLAGQGVEGLNAAMGIQGQRQDQAMQQQRMGMDQQRMAMLTREEARQIEDRAAQMSAAERAAAAAQAEEAVKMALGAQTPEQFDEIMRSMGAPQHVGQFNMRDALSNKYMSVVDILKKNAGPEYRPATPEEAAQYGVGGQVNTQSGKYEPITPPKNTSIEMTPGGGFRYTDGAGKAQVDTGQLSPSSPAAMLDSINGVLADPALDTSTGILSPLQAIPGTPMRRFGTRVEQLNGQAFLQAFESLKGAGQITEIEGTKATQAIGRLDSAQSPADYREALNELKTLLETGVARAQASATGTTELPPVPEGVNSDTWPSLFDAMTKEQRALFQ